MANHKAQVLKLKYIHAIRGNQSLILAIAEANDKRLSTVQRWLREEDQMLTTATNLAIIRYHFNLDESVELTEPKREVNLV